MRPAATPEVSSSGSHGSGSRIALTLQLLLVAIGVHSMVLGLYVYFLTPRFYDLIFSTDVEGYFFVRQSGVLLFCMGGFYVFPAANIRKYHALIPIILAVKILAVLFLLANSQFTPNPTAILGAAFVDGLMALLLIAAYASCKLKRVI